MDEIIFFEFKYGDLILIRKQYCFLLHIFIIILLKMCVIYMTKYIKFMIIFYGMFSTILSYTNYSIDVGQIWVTKQ